MYEKPQYLTKDGYKRLDKNPHRDDAPTFKLVPKKKALVKASSLPQGPRKGVKLSDNAAKMIAMVLKEMLKDPK